MNIAIYTLTSELHDEQAVSAVTREFLDSLDVTYEFKGNDYSDYGSHSLDLIYVRTGGTEGIFRRLLSKLQAKSAHPYFLTNPIGNHHIILPGHHKDLLDYFFT